MNFFQYATKKWTGQPSGTKAAWYTLHEYYSNAPQRIPGNGQNYMTVMYPIKYSMLQIQ